MTVDTLRQRRLKLIALRARVQAELEAVERGLQVAGALPLGRRSNFPVITTAEARAAHAAYVRGDRTPEVIAGQREYARDSRRQQRARRAS